MDYQKNYNDYIKYAKTLNRKKGEGTYYEKHHIVPTSLGGSNEKENLVLLTAREHYLAHYLLWKIYDNAKMMVAFWCMNNMKPEAENLYLNSRLYEKSKAAYIAWVKKNKSKQIICFETGDIFNSCLEAAEWMLKEKGIKIRSNSISSSANKNTSVISAGGFHWYYPGEDPTFREDKHFETQYPKEEVVCLETGEIFKSMGEAGRKCGSWQGLIYRAIKKGIRTAGYHWEYLKNYSSEKNKYLQKSRGSLTQKRKVICLETGEEFESIAEAVKKFGFGHIGDVCRGTRNNAGGLTFKFKED